MLRHFFDPKRRKYLKSLNMYAISYIFVNRYTHPMLPITSDTLKSQSEFTVVVSLNIWILACSKSLYFWHTRLMGCVIVSVIEALRISNPGAHKQLSFCSTVITEGKNISCSSNQQCGVIASLISCLVVYFSLLLRYLRIWIIGRRKSIQVRFRRLDRDLNMRTELYIR